ncbi:hypothetical protein OG413_11595 [Streptomyces sp. NBC_01433]|uniref:hypothetical protein n=1 Tax=Streptomyces sp. NBC_01433 TaxID=2903864 RepID=UPI002253CFEC|nr:hypothetical protein [Streptomyces sp. NBC_01433]MCX4675942.1 hypothetical protein [Streptomyces sp. NBC_01433]
MVMKKVLVSCAVVVSAALLGTSPAVSSVLAPPAPGEPSMQGHDGRVKVTDRAYGYSFDHASKSSAYVVAWDDAAEKAGDPVYLNYYRKADSGKKKTLWNKRGGGTYTTSSKGGALYRMNICVSEFINPDECGPELVF